MTKELFRVEGKPITSGKFYDVQMGPSTIELIPIEYDRTNSMSIWVSPPLSTRHAMLSVEINTNLLKYQEERLLFTGNQANVGERSHDSLDMGLRRIYNAAVNERNKNLQEKLRRKFKLK